MENMAHFDLSKNELFQSISDGHVIAFMGKGEFWYVQFY